MSDRDTAMWWARIRSGGPQRVPPGGATPSGLRRLVEPDAQAVWLLPNLPGPAGPAVLEEYGLPGAPIADPKGSLRVLAACLRCCWADPGTEIWPGTPAGFEEVAVVFTHLVPDQDRPTRHRTLLSGVRRLASSGWLRFDERGRVVRLGPRVASWDALELSTLREIWRLVPSDEHSDPADPADPVQHGEHGEQR